MRDYASYISRAEHFVRRTNHLPGKWGISIDIAAPLPAEEADRLDGTLPFGLPGPLRDFYVTGSARCDCTFWWSPDEAHLPQVKRVFLHRYSIYGGPSFIPADELLDAHGVHTWWDGCEGTEDAPEFQVWRETIPFIAVGNGDYLALHAKSDRAEMPVVYLCHEDSEHPVTEVSPSFEQFMTDWETLYWVGPDGLEEFLSDGQDGIGPLQIGQPKTKLWRDLITGCGK